MNVKVISVVVVRFYLRNVFAYLTVNIGNFVFLEPKASAHIPLTLSGLLVLIEGSRVWISPTTAEV